MNLIGFVILCTLAVAVKGSMTKEAIETVRIFTADCLKELGATEAVFDEMVKNLPASSMDIKCLRACLLKRIKLLTPEGKFHKDNALKIAEMHTGGDAEKMKIAQALVDVCDAISVPDDHCEAAEMYKMCILSEAEKHGIKGLM